MKTGRLEAFSDGVMAVILTIMVLELKIPLGEDLLSLKPQLPTLTNYILSFIYVGIYWNNHHHLFNVIEKINGKILWCNLHLLFWLSLLPVTTAWVNEHIHANYPVAIYGFILLMCCISFMILEYVAMKHEGKESLVGESFKNKRKEYISYFGYLIGIGISFIIPEIALLFIC